MSRIYKDGRDTGRWTRGEKVLSVSDAEPGDILYMVVHQFPSDNLIRVTGKSDLKGGGFYYYYLDGDLSCIGNPPRTMHIWPWELNDGIDLYKVVADPNHTEDEE